jgi:two-component system sensor kinase FixL
MASLLLVALVATMLLSRRRAPGRAERLSRMSELAASSVHELNQPLAAILSNAQAARQILATNPSDLTELDAILEDIENDDERAVAILRRMDLRRPRATGRPELMDVREIVDEVVRRLRSEAARRGSRITIQLDEQATIVRGDREQLCQVLLNLVLNAFDAMETCDPAEREVRLTSRRSRERSVTVTVSDRGVGIPAERLETVFQAFSTTKPNGLGLGLATSRSIVEAHGGRLWVERHAERGVTFGFEMPLAELPAAVAQAPVP